MKTIIAIDPGVSGGIAWKDPKGRMCAVAMSDTLADVRDLIAGLIVNKDETVVLIEKLTGFIPKGTSTSGFKMGQSYGFLQGAVMSQFIRLEEVRPQEWQARLGLGAKRQYEGREWKNHLKGVAQKLHPEVYTWYKGNLVVRPITLMTADALLIWEYGRSKHG